MTTKELIKKLQEVDSSGKLEVKMASDFHERNEARQILAVWNDIERVMLLDDPEMI